jgi:hypothetical protein
LLGLVVLILWVFGKEIERAEPESGFALADLVEAVTTLFAAGWIAFEVARRSSTDARILDYIDDSLDSLATQMNSLQDIFTEYRDSHDVELVSSINRGLKALSVQVTGFVDTATELALDQSTRSDIRKLKDQFIDYKKSVTDSPFGTNDSYSPDQIVNNANAFETIRKSLVQIRLYMLQQ